jgi:hypothetical protein
LVGGAPLETSILPDNNRAALETRMLPSNKRSG